MKVQSCRAANLRQKDIYVLVPLFLCPALLHPLVYSPPRRNIPNAGRSLSTVARRCLEAVPSLTAGNHSVDVALNAPKIPIPVCCPGCGAPSQMVLPKEPGYYTPSRKGLAKKHLRPSRETEDDVVETALKKIGKRRAVKLGLVAMKEKGMYTQDTEPEVPICDRCHHLIHHRIGEPIQHPSLKSIQATIDESPHQYNHIYHVLDAADFPMSLLPNLHKTLDAHLRTKNRRQKEHHWKQGHTIDMSFIITRSDLLAPQKDQVDKMMPTLIEILRDALGQTGQHVRLGNVRCVSSKRGWWTKEAKEAIWERGGGGWFVGKVNVGKSNLFETVFPKGRDQSVNFDRIRNESRNLSSQLETKKTETLTERAFDGKLSLLPPAQEETKYPVMPITSELPGTTASPIRIPYGNGRGELVDLPGLARASPESSVLPDHKLDLVMKRRISPERIVVKPGSSLLLGGGLVRITPRTPDLIFMLHAFVPLDTHLTSTAKAIDIQAGQREAGIRSIVDPDAKAKMSTAGIFKLSSDVTRKHAGPLTRKDAVGLQPSRLPFIVYSTDILIEGCGWIEVVAQVRKPKREHRDALAEAIGELPEATPFPEIEVFSPEGKFVGQRRTLSAWLVGGRSVKKAKEKGRPRRSMASMRGSREGRGLPMTF